MDSPTQNVIVRYSDDDLLVVDKPAGLLTHATTHSNEPTLADWAKSHTSDDEPLRAGIVHRLDRDTSGLIIIAKNKSAKQYLQKLLKAREIKKTYTALVRGIPALPEAKIDLPLGRSLRAPTKRRVNLDGKSAITYYKVISELAGKALLEVKPESGRTHQIRVHLAHIGHPIIGDEQYGGGSHLPRQFLHASRLEFIGPSQQVIDVSSPLPKDLEQFLQEITP